MATKKTTTATKKVASKKKVSNKVKRYANDRDLAITDIEKTITLPRGACAIIINPNMSIEFIEPDKSAKEDSAAIVFSISYLVLQQLQYYHYLVLVKK